MISNKKCENCANYQRLHNHFQGGLCFITDMGIRGDHQRQDNKIVEQATFLV